MLGSVDFRRDGDPVPLSAQHRQLLAIMVAAGPTGQSTEWLAEQLWPGGLPPEWQAKLRTALARLRKRLGLPLEGRGGRYRLEVDPAAVDAWNLLRLDAATTEWDRGLEPLLTEVHPFPSVEPAPGLQQAANEITATQHSAIAKLARHPIPASPRLLVAVARHAAEHPDNEGLATAVATTLARAGRVSEAQAVVETALQARRAAGLPLSSDLEHLRDDITAGRPLPGSILAPAPTPTSAPAPDRPSPRSRPARYRADRYRAEHFVGRQHEMEALHGLIDTDRTAVVVVRGRAAWGKTTLLGEAMHRAVEADAHVVRVAGTAGGRVGLGPFSRVVPAFRALLAADETPVADSLPRRGMLAAHLLDHLEADADGRRIVVVVDDAHWLDSMSCDVVDYLAHAAIDGALSLVVAARPDEGDAPWVALEQALDRLPGVTSLALEPLSEPELADLVAHHRPDTSFASRAQLTRWLHHASGGLPGVAAALLDEGADGTDLPLPTRPEVSEVYDRRLAPLSGGARDVGGAAAVLGSPFLLTDLAQLLDRTEVDLEPALTELHRHALLAEGPTLGQFELSHQLVADAFLRTLLSTRRARFHQRAAELAASVHDLARHQVQASTLVPPDEARATVIRSAREHLTAGAHWESVAAFRTAVELGSTSLDVAALVDYATALSLAGMRNRSATVRARAHGQAMADERYDLALDAALSGLPAAEISDGEHDRLAQILAIPPDGLDPARRVRQALYAARQGAMLGQLAEAEEWSIRAETLADDDNERAEAALTRRFATDHTEGPAVRLARMQAATAGLAMEASARCRLAQFAALDHFCCGHIGPARKAHAEFESLAVTSGDVLRQWHALIFASLLHDNDGDWAKADATADEALALGHRHGLTQADILRLAQVYFRLRLTGDLALLAGSIDTVPGDDGESIMFAAARATILEASGQEQEAGVEAVRIARLVTGRPSTAGIGSLVIVAPLVGRYGPPSLVAATRAILRPFESSAYVLAAGIGNLGPVDYLITTLDRPSGRALQQSLRRAVRLADEFGMLPWQVRYRLDLAAVTGSDEPRDQARELAHGTALADLADRDPATLHRL